TPWGTSGRWCASAGTSSACTGWLGRREGGFAPRGTSPAPGLHFHAPAGRERTPAKCRHNFLSDPLGNDYVAPFKSDRLLGGVGRAPCRLREGSPVPPRVATLQTDPLPPRDDTARVRCRTARLRRGTRRT